MMVMAAGGEVNLAGILSSLKPKTASKDDKIEAYTAISNQLKDDALNLLVLDIAKHAKEVMTVLRRDILDSSEDVCQVALQVLGFCLHDRDVISALPSANGGSVLKSLCECIMRTEDKTTCTRALWCLNKQNLTADDIKAEIGNILSAVEHSMGKWKNLSITVEYEAMNVVARLTEQHPKVLSASVSRWTKLILPFIIHDAVKVRELVLETLTKTVDLILPSQKDIVKDLIPEMKTHICPGLKKLMVNKNEIFVLKTWSVVVQILGQELHHGSFINNLLSIVEMGFKSSSADVKCAAFLAWQQLIDNFALNPAVVGDPKRVKLMMQLFKNNNAKVESVAMVKLSVWWHFIWLLGPKASALFDQVCTPLLQFCLGGSKMTNQIPGTTPRALGTGSSPVTPRINLPSSGSQFSTFPALQLAGCEVLAHFLGSIPDDLDLPPYSFTLDALSSDIITGASFFLKQSNILVSMATDLICSRGKDIPEGLLFRIWYSLIAHMKNAVESGAKSEIRETVTGLLSSFQVIVLSQIFSDQIILKLFQAICCLPRKILCSTAYNMKNGEMIHGTPALFLTELLLTPSLLKLAKSSESFFSLLNTLINYGMSNPSGALEFCYSIVQLLGRNASFVDDGEILWRLWSAIIHPLQEHITQTNEVNQGDVLEYNFDCMYTALVFPISQRLPQNISQASSKTLLKTWTDVYRSFARLSALVTNAEANISCEDLCQRLLDAVNADTSLEPVFLDFLVQICVVVINSVDFSSLGSNTIFNLNVSSPAKRNRRRQKPMENINSLVILTGQLVDSANKVISPAEVPFKKPASSTVPMPAIANGLVDILTMLFTHISSNTIISCLLNELSSPIAELFHGSIKKSGSKIFNNAFCQRLEKLWLDISTCIQGRYSGMYDTELLSKVGPLLEATFLHPRRAIKNQTTILWNATFSRAADLSYPLSLVPVLTKVKEKTPIQLPGWNFQTIIIEETPISQMSQAESQAPAAHIPGMPSPHKIHGSFLGKAISPSVKRSPAKSVVMDRPGASSVKKKLSINDLNDEAFVVIKSPVKKKRVLTEHQKEVLKEKKAFPTMYSNLDVSQDISLMSALNTDTQQSQTIDSPMNTGQSLDFSGFGKVLNKDPEPRIESAKGDYNEKQKIPPADKMKIPSKPARRRSVRFKDSESSVDCEESQKSSFSEILQNKLENGTSLPKDSEENEFEQSNELLPSDQSKASPLIQNVLGAIGPNTGDSVSTASKSASLDSGKSTEKVGENVEPHSQTLFTEASEKSQNSLNVSNSICSPERKKHPLQFVTSPSEAKSPISKPMINRSPSRKSSESLKNVDKKIEMFGKLDQWLIRQPTIKSSVESKTLLSSEASEILTVTVVEDTQSPTKFSQRSEMYNDNQPPIQETPPRKEGEIIGNKDTSSTRQLFKDADDSVINLDESDNIIPSSPPSKKLSLSVRSSPLVKLQKKNDGNKSPNEKDCSADTKEVDVESTRNSIVEDDMDIATSETQEDSNSQGFRISTSTMNSGIQKPDCLSSTESQISDVLQSNNKKCVATSSGSSDSSKIEAEQSKIAIQDITESGVSFSDLISQESNRGNESVLEVLATNSDKKDSYSINTPHTSHTVVKHSSNNKEHSSESDSYEDSNLNSSLSNEKEHKRKQATPKKMSLDSVRKSKRKRKMSEKYSEHVKNVESTPKSSKMKKTSEENPSHTSELNLSEQSLDLSSKSSKRKTRRNSVLETKSTKLDSAEVDDTEEKSQIATEEKTPETKTQRTPGRKSTTKQKKEIAQRRSLLREKVRVNQTNTNLERSSSDDEVVFNLSGKKLEARKIMNSDSSEDNLLLSQVKKNVVVSDTKSTEITGNTDVGEKIAITTSSLESSDDDISLKKIVDSRTPNFGNSTRERGHLLANTVTVKENTDQKEIESSTNDPQNESQILDKLENELQDNPSKSDGNSSAKPFKLQNVVSCQKKASLKVSPMSTRLRSSGRVLRTRSKALSRSPLLKKVLKNRKTPQKETRGKDGDSAKVDEVVKKDCLENETVTLIEKDPVKLDEPIEENSEEIGESLDKESGKTDQDKSSKSDDDMIFCDKLSDENQNIWASSVPSVEITVELKESSDSGSDKLSEENVPTEVQSTTEPTTVPEETDKLPNLEETPRSGEKTSAFRAFLSNSDGKLLTASRKFERSPLVRRNIIKPISTLGICSPRRRQSHDFQPIRGIKACSPSASPSAGILKRRRFSVGAVTESPSPPNKQRRVSFAEPLVLKKTEEQRPPSPLVTCASTTNGDATNKSSIDKLTSSSEAAVDGSASPVRSGSSGKTISQATVSQTSYCSTQESQLNQIEPVYPELVQCQVEVGQVLPQLTSSMWSRGLGQLVRARNIHTVGDLSSLTEREIDSLPIRSPKVATVRRVLQTFESRTKTIKQSPLALEKSIEVNRAEKKNSSDRLPKIQEVEMEDALNDEAQVLPTLEEALSALSPQKVEGSNKTANEDADVLPTLEDALSELSPHKDVESISSQAAASYSEQSLVSSIASLAENCTKEQLKTLQTEDIFKIYQHLNSMTQTVVTALRTKCSPDRTLKK